MGGKRIGQKKGASHLLCTTVCKAFSGAFCSRTRVVVLKQKRVDLDKI